MKILVAAACVTDPNVPLRLTADQQLDLANAKLLLNPFDEVAIEQAVIMKNCGLASETIVVTIGPQSSIANVLRPSLAMGMDRAIHVPYEKVLDARSVAHALSAIVTQEKPSLVLVGKQTSDNGSGQVGGYLAAMLGWAQATAATKIEVVADGFKVVSDTDDGAETRMLSLPAVVTTSLSLNNPRYLSLPAMMKARSKPIETLPISAALSFVEQTRMTCVRAYAEPPKRAAGTLIENAQALAPILAQAANLTL